MLRMLRRVSFSRAACKRHLQTLSTARKNHNTIINNNNKSDNVMVFASELGVICGYNPYQTKVSLFEKLWQRSYMDSWSSAGVGVEKETGQPVLSQEVRVERLLADAGLHQVLEKKLPQVTRETASAADVVRTEKEMVQEVERLGKDWSPPARQQMKQEVQRSIRTSYGAAQELPTIQAIQREEKILVQENNSRFYKRKLDFYTVESKKPVFVGGRVDGFKNGSLVEIKNRIRQLYDPLPVYDLAQFQCYLFVLDLPNGEMIQRLKFSNESDPNSRSSIVIERDDKFWKEDVEPRIQAFVNALDAVASHDGTAREYLRLHEEREKAAFIDDLLPHA